MNREYAYNRDKGKCKCCYTELNTFNLRTHHIDPKLPDGKLNIVSNLASVCHKCHSDIHNWDINKQATGKREKRIAKYAMKL